MSALTDALGAPPPQPDVDRLCWVLVDSVPRMVSILDPNTGAPIGHYPDAVDVEMTDAMADRFRAVCDDVDSASCEAEGCQAGPDYRRADGSRPPAAVGFVLAGEADERMEWRALALVQRGQRVIAVCEDCSPSTVYATLWTETS